MACLANMTILQFPAKAGEPNMLARHLVTAPGSLWGRFFLAQRTPTDTDASGPGLCAFGFPATSGVGCDYASEPNSKVYAPRCSAGCFPTQLYLLGLLYQNQGLCAALRVHARSMPEAEVRSAANQVDSTGVPPSCTSLRGIGVRGVGGFAVVREICLRS